MSSAFAPSGRNASPAPGDDCARTAAWVKANATSPTTGKPPKAGQRTRPLIPDTRARLSLRRAERARSDDDVRGGDQGERHLRVARVASGKPRRLHRRTTGPRISPAGYCFECTLKYQRPSLRSLAWASSILTTPWKGLARLPGVATWIGAFSSGVRPRYDTGPWKWAPIGAVARPE